MKKKIIGIFVCTLLIATAVPAVVSLKNSNINEEKTSYKENINNKLANNNQGFGYLGCIPLPDTIKSTSLKENGNPPAAFDWRNYNGQDWTSPAKNQGNCGSCWDFAACSTLEAVINIVEGNASLDLDLSEQYILSCYSGGRGCSGDNAYYAYQYMVNNGGTIPEECFTYTADDATPCSSKCADWQEKLVPIVSYGYSVNPGLPAMKDKLVTDGPFCVDFDCYSDLYTGSPSFDANGVYKYDGVSSYRGGHQICAVGYVDTPTNPNYPGYWICKNSWGSTWGPWGNGFFGIAYGQCGIDDNLVWVSYSSTAPDTSILSGPSGTINSGNVAFTWTGSDGTTPTSGLVYSYKLNGHDVSWSSWSSATTTTYSNLHDGSYTFDVKAKDKSGIPDYTPAERSFTVKLANSPPVFGTPSPANGSTSILPSLTWSIPINDPEGNTFTWTIQCNNGQTNGATGATNGTKSLSLSGLTVLKTYTVWVNATDPAGSGLYTRRWYTFTTGTVDQLQMQYNANFAVYMNRWGGQSFIPAVILLTHVELYMQKVGSPTDVVLSVRSSLSGADLVSLSIPASQIPTSYGWVDFDFSDISVTPGSTYYLVLKTSGGSITNCYNWGYGSNTPYTRGTYWQTLVGGIMWTQYVGYDFCFKTSGILSLIPVLSYSPSSYNFGNVAQNDAGSTSFEIWNSGQQTLTYSLSKSSSWVTVTPTSGSSTGEHDSITVSIDTTGLSLGSYTCPVSISSNGGSGTFTVYMTVVTPTPLLAYSPVSYDFGGMTAGKTSSTTFEIWNSGTGTLTYSLSKSSSWVTVTPTSGSCKKEHNTITVRIDTTGLSLGSYTCPVSISSNGGSGTFTVYLTVIPPIVLDQQQTQYNNVNFAVYLNRFGGQSFIPTVSSLTHAALYMQKVGSPPDVVLSVRSSLSGADLVSLSMPASQISTSIGWVDFDFSDISVTPGSTYYLVLKTSGGSSTNCYNWGYGVGTPYTRGTYWQTVVGGLMWTQYSGYDFCFKTYGM